ncbi:cystathionine gamma-synthase [Myxococcus xanthus]|uniref:trans-sulfuration enzyme family protein n=1 Tax=Myxococcus xanthus TaxID=34 RepID=UPI001128DEB9|nr:aminotransferase class I/II-fold pyridoxal phosphate-dependent enzyme [Myxococcus xanthus]QDE88973.1 cystathionine gamma-synthase [Myxococcus xanthus]
MTTNTLGLSTRCIHAGDSRDSLGAVHTPLYSHSTFAFASTSDVLDVVEGRKTGNLYTRYGMNPTIRSVEEKLASIEGGENAWVFSSGMAAESATFLSFCKAGDHIICIGDVYGGTFELLGQNLPSVGITTTFLLGSELDKLDAAVKDNTRIIFFETPTNPNMEVFDVRAIAEIAHRRGVLVVVDNTFATPVNQSPLALGADLVIHSTTKYLGGHSDLTGGVVIGSSKLLQPIWTWRKNLGQMMAPEVAHLLARSLRTLVIRVKAHNEGAALLARRLSEHPRVERVSYPGLPTHPQHELAKRQMRGFGGMLSFVVRGDAKAAAAVVDRLKLFAIAPSLGGVESLVTQPVTTTHHGLTPEERGRRSISDGMVRLSVGLEEAEDLWADLAQALEG